MFGPFIFMTLRALKSAHTPRKTAQQLQKSRVRHRLKEQPPLRGAMFVANIFACKDVVDVRREIGN